MKLKHLAVLLVGISILGMGLWGTAPSDKVYLAKKKTAKERIREKQRKAREVRRRNKTMFADGSFDSIKVNQMLLTFKKDRISSN